MTSEGPGAGRFTRRPRRETDDEEHSAGSPDDLEAKQEARLSRTLDELRTCFDHAAEIVSWGQERIQDDWLVRRAAKNIVTELAESVSRLPATYRDRHTMVAWRDVAGMRNRVVHNYEEVDFQVVWQTLVHDLPNMRKRLGL
ncbi:MAG: DUF86 domain-containing protein [Acidimicrobiaceae bacterium]|nr:DUF86 domain-containing protein [Acidimicrobiaceae bacterium]